MARKNVAMLFAFGVIAAAACDGDDRTPAGTTVPTEAVCGNGVTEEGEACDPYAPNDTWSCPTRQCSNTCACTDEMNVGGGGAGGDGGSGGSPVPGLPIGGDGTIACDAPSGTPGALKLTRIAGNFDQPVLAVAPPGEANRLYVVEQPGRIMLYQDGERSVFLDVTDRVTCCGERGLLGLAFHPDYASNGRFFIHYSDKDTGGDTRLVEYERDPNDADVALPTPVGAPLLTEPQPASNHNGGAIGFSPTDGHLYIALGDGGGGNIQNGQNITTRLGSVLRLDVSTTPAVAAGNYPGGDSYIWDVGLRNPWRASFDACTGDYYIGDVGQNALEEINVEPSGTGHLNFGWALMEASACYQPPSGCDMTGLTLPAAEYSHDGGNCSVTGGYVYRGDAIPWLRGTYFYGDACSGKIWSFVWDGASATDLTDRSTELDSQGNMFISSFGQDASGEIYVVSLNSGELYRVEAE